MFLGLDIGTTSICAVVIDDDCRTLYTLTKPNHSHASGLNGERTQSPEQIYKACNEAYKDCLQKFDIKGIGISGQMHGILYLDKNGNALSPLYSWQDERGNLSFKRSTYAKALSKISGYQITTGFGAASLFYDLINGSAPNGAATFCTIGDYIAMRLANKKEPLINETNAASIGLYDIFSHGWDYYAIQKTGLAPLLFPKTTAQVEKIGETTEHVSVFTSIGDNQASVYGADLYGDSAIVNIGTGSQISVITSSYRKPPKGCEIRPYFNDKYLITGCALCGGYSYKLLKDFYNSVSPSEITYTTMNEWAKSAMSESTPVTRPLFRGTRSNPRLKAYINGLSESNFNAKCLTLSVLKGISAELEEYYEKIITVTDTPRHLIGSGNALRMNGVLRKIIEYDFRLKLNVPANNEEAAFGAAIIAAENLSCGKIKKQIAYL